MGAQRWPTRWAGRCPLHRRAGGRVRAHHAPFFNKPHWACTPALEPNSAHAHQISISTLPWPVVVLNNPSGGWANYFCRWRAGGLPQFHANEPASPPHHASLLVPLMLLYIDHPAAACAPPLTPMPTCLPASRPILPPDIFEFLFLRMLSCLVLRVQTGCPPKECCTPPTPALLHIEAAFHFSSPFSTAHLLFPLLLNTLQLSAK